MAAQRKSTNHTTRAGATEDRAAVYVRVSTGGQVDGTSIDGQLDQCRAEARRRGWSIAGEFIDAGVSGAKNSRPALDEMLAAAAAGAFDVVLIAKLDRLGRSLLHLLTLMQQLDSLGIRVVSASDNIDTRTPAGRMMVQLLGVFAEFERERIRERSQEGVRRRVEEGGFVSSIPPFGYRAVADPSGRRGAVLDIEPAQAACIRAIYQHIVVDRTPLSRAVHVLNGEGHLSPKGAAWTMGTLTRWVRGGGHLTAAGTWRWNDLAVPIPPILTAEQAADWSAWATDTLRPQRDRVGYLLSGFVSTPCGRRYFGRTAGKQSPVYACGNHLDTPPSDPEHCECRNISVAALDAAVWAEVTSILSDPTALSALAREISGVDRTDIGEDTVGARRHDAAQAISNLQQRIADDYRAAIDDGFDTETARLMVRPLQTELIAAKAEIARLGRARAAARRAAFGPDVTAVATKTLAQSVDNLDLSARRDVLAALGVEVKVTTFEACPRCGGTGYGPKPTAAGRRPPQPCGRCRRMRMLPVIEVAITAPEALLIGNDRPGPSVAI